MMNKFLSLIYSTRLMGILFLVFAISMGVATFIENNHGTETAKALVYNAWWFEVIMVLFAVNFFGNLFKFKLYRKKKWVVLLFHLAFFFILLGAGITRYISYEGTMPLREGQTSNAFLSEKNYISIAVNNGKEQKTPYHKNILLSSLGSNNFHYKTDFRSKDVSVKLINYIPNARDVFEEDENGDTYLKFVESGGGGRHDHYIKKGSSEVVHGILVGYDSEVKNGIDFKTVDGKLKIRSEIAGTFFRMADKFQGIVAKDSLQDFSPLAVHSIGGLQFVVPNNNVTGFYKTIAGERDPNNPGLAQLEFDVKAGTETKLIKLRGGKLAIQTPTQFSLGGLNFRMSYGAMQLKLPFSIKLNDFQLDKYPGSNSPMSFASEITVIDPEETFNFRIFMNNILNYKGFKFFQSSYNITSQYEETFLSVNHDFLGSTITYIGYFLLYAGLILILFFKNTRFDSLRKSLRKIQHKKTKVSTIILLLLSTWAFSQQNHAITEKQIDSALTASTVSSEHSELFSKLVIQGAGGRMKPIHTYSSELLRKVSKHDTYKDMNSTQVLLSIQQNPRIWFRVPIIYIEKGNTKLRDLINVPHDQKYASLSDFFDLKGGYLLSDVQQKAQKSNIKSKFEKDVVNVDRRVNLLYSAIVGSILRIFPIPDDPENRWVNHNALKTTNLKGRDTVIRNILPFYMQTLTAAIKSNDYTQAEQILDGLTNYQKKYGSAVYPSERKIELEITYNKYDIFKKLFSYYMYIGTLMFFFVIFRIFNENKVINFLIKAGIAIIIGLFLAHTGGLIARWIVSGHAPWSNAYESMIYVGWATMLFGLIFGRKSSMTIAATAFLTAFILMVAHWNWMDPEIENLVPVLNSYWLMIHVAIIVASYGPFALGMILGLISLILMVLTTKKNKKKIGVMIKEMTIINEMSLTVGLVLLVIGNFLGGMWANESWGRYWGWDPKETWALISIMIYAFVLHLRLIPGLRSRFTFNLLSVAAFASILMTYFGVNFYLSGLHAYASGDKVITPNFVFYTIGIVGVITILAFVQYKKHYKK